MQELEIKEVQSGAVYRVSPEGAVLGREGAKADIVIRNPSVSKRHAKIYESDGEWFLEDLGSSNGTFFANQRISEPVAISPGALFALAEIQFEVVRPAGGKNAENGRVKKDDRLRGPTAARKDEALVDADSFPPARGERDRGTNPPDGDDDEGGGGGGRGSGGGKIPAGGIGDFLGAIPKAIGHYLITVPKLAVNPIGTVRASIEEQNFPAMGFWTLAGWMIPVTLANLVLGLIATAIVSLVNGVFSFSTLFPIVPLVIGVAIGLVSSLVGGFLFHPVLGWVIKFLKGRSDETSRSNYFVMLMTGSALAIIPTAVTALFGLIPFRFVAIIPIALTLVASLISLYILFAWLKFFDTVRWTHFVPLALMVLATLGSAMSILGAVTGGPAVAGSAATANLTAEQAKALADAQALAAKAGGDGAKAAEEAAKLIAKANEDAAKAAKAGEKTVADMVEKSGEKAAEDVAKAAADAKAAAEKAAADTKAAAEKAADDAKAQEKAAEKAAEKVAEKAAEKTPEKAPEKVDNARPPVERGGRDELGTTPYIQFTQKRDSVEKAILDDPTLLRSVPGLLDKYERYQKTVFEIKKANGAKRPKNEPWRDKVSDRLLSAELYDKTKPMVEELHQKIFR